MKILIALLLFFFSANIAFAQDTIKPPQVSAIPTTAPAVITSLDLREYVNTQSDRMVDRIDKMLMWVIGLGTLIIAVVALIGGYIVWNNAQFRKQAQDDLNEIRSSKEQVNKIMTEAKTLSAQLIKSVSAISDNLKKSTEEVKNISEMKKLIQNAAKEVDSVKNNYINSSLVVGTVSPSDYKPFSFDDFDSNSLRATSLTNEVKGSNVLNPLSVKSVLDEYDVTRTGLNLKTDEYNKK